jgi:uncharacterized membrane protein YphA (DoxX/SURF4 family)
VLLAFAVLFERLGGLMHLIAYRERLGAALLILMLVPSRITLLFHSFCFFEVL